MNGSVFSNDVKRGMKLDFNPKRTLEDIRPQLQEWLAQRRAMEAIKNRLAWLAEVDRLRENGLDENDAFKNLWPEVHTWLMARGKEARDWLESTGDESILGK